MLKKLTILFAIFFLCGCLFSSKITIKGKGNIKLEQVDFSDLKNWELDDHQQAMQAFLHSCKKFAKMAQTRPIGGQMGDVTAEDFRDVCDIAEVVKTMNRRQAKNFFENWFKPFLVKGRYGNSTGVFTGYYEASLRGSKVKTDVFKYPIYAKPDDLNSDPYLSRKEIEAGALGGKGLELLYVDDKVDLFFMHIQGSGRVTLPNGSEVRVAYAARNNHPYISIGNSMVEAGVLEAKNLNAATVREWLKQNFDRADEFTNINNAYIFFKISDNDTVVGGQGVPLTPERSLAIDTDIIPYGIPLFVDTELKQKNGTKHEYQRLFIAQDTGSAIKGTVRGDIFFGHGDTSEELASYMASRGQYYALLPINLVDKMTGKF